MRAVRDILVRSLIPLTRRDDTAPTTPGLDGEEEGRGGE